MNRVLLTGANGFLGRSLAHEYAKDKNTEVICITRDDNRNLVPWQGTTILKGDITDFDFLRRVIADYEITDVVHLAAQAIVRVCANDPVSAYDTNVMGTVKLLEAVRQVGMSTVKSIVVSTSDKAYGHAPPPYTEKTPLMPMYTYESTKSCQDIVSQNYFHNYGLPIKIARCSNIYGPGDPNYSRLVPNTIKRILTGKRPQIYTGVMNYIREWVYVADTVNAFQLILKEGINGEAYCVGGTERASVTNLVERMLKLCNSNLEIEYIDKAAAFKEIEEQWIDSTKLQSLGWKPQFTLDQGLANTIQYYKGL